MFQSTRSTCTVSDTAAVLQGIAPDGGLFVDAGIASRSFDVKSCMGLGYTEIAKKVFAHLLPEFSEKIPSIVSVYPKKFSAAEITPLRAVGDAYALELYHGPTCAFKDVALSVLPLLITAAKETEGVKEKIAILTATSGDTGKAALEGFHDVPGTEITVFFPDGGVSPMQKAQMVTQEGGNVRVCAVRGNFDDCQRGVKEAFAAFHADPLRCAGRILSSANSINVGRLIPQVVYYFSAYSQLLSAGRISYGEKADFVVPTGNFGDILAGYLAMLMGLPVGSLVCASNANNVLTDFIRTGVYDRRRPFLKTSSPSMDILVSSNLERLLFYAAEGDTELVASLMHQLNTEGAYTLSGKPIQHIQEHFLAGCCTEEETRAAIADLWKEHGWLSDTHTAVGFAVAQKLKGSLDSSRPCVVLSTASPFKFPSAVLSALGGTPQEDEFETAANLSALTGIPVPASIAGLKEKKVLHTDVIPVAEVVDYALRSVD
ncbi:MAG: threonine synthase [Oscillospiraceae bacterium]|nr:threonine synthase [Oscillospiraceae bacterium]